MPYFYHARGRGRFERCGPGSQRVGKESGELSKGQDAGTWRVAPNSGPTQEINRGWFPSWFPDHSTDFGRMERVLPNQWWLVAMEHSRCCGRHGHPGGESFSMSWTIASVCRGFVLRSAIQQVVNFCCLKIHHMNSCGDIRYCYLYNTAVVFDWRRDHMLLFAAGTIIFFRILCG